MLRAGPDRRLRVKVQPARPRLVKLLLSGHVIPQPGPGSALNSRMFSRFRPVSARIRRTAGLSDRMMAGQPPGAKPAAIASARSPEQSRNVTPARSSTNRSVRSPTTRDACRRNPLAAEISRSPSRMSVHTAPSRMVVIVRSSVSIASQSARGVWTTPTEDSYFHSVEPQATIVYGRGSTSPCARHSTTRDRTGRTPRCTCTLHLRTCACTCAALPNRLSARRRCTGAVFLALDCPARGHRV